MNKIISMLTIAVFLMVGAACSKKDAQSGEADTMTETLTEGVNNAEKAAANAGKEAVDQAASMGDDAMSKAGDVVEEAQSKTEDMAAGAEEMADDAMNDAAVEAARLEEEAKEKLGLDQ